MRRPIGPRQLRERIVGRTISGVIARPGGDGEPPVVMLLRFEDGSVVDFVSPRSDRLLRQALAESRSAAAEWPALGSVEAGLQLSLDGLFVRSSGSPSKPVVA